MLCGHLPNIPNESEILICAAKCEKSERSTHGKQAKALEPLRDFRVRATCLKCTARTAVDANTTPFLSESVYCVKYVLKSNLRAQQQWAKRFTHEKILKRSLTDSHQPGVQRPCTMETHLQGMFISIYIFKGSFFRDAFNEERFNKNLHKFRAILWEWIKFHPTTRIFSYIVNRLKILWFSQ